MVRSRFGAVLAPPPPGDSQGFGTRWLAVAHGHHPSQTLVYCPFISCHPPDLQVFGSSALQPTIFWGAKVHVHFGTGEGLISGGGGDVWMEGGVKGRGGGWLGLPRPQNTPPPPPVTMHWLDVHSSAKGKTVWAQIKPDGCCTPDALLSSCACASVMGCVSMNIAPVHCNSGLSMGVEDAMDTNVYHTHPHTQPPTFSRDVLMGQHWDMRAEVRLETLPPASQEVWEQRLGPAHCLPFVWPMLDPCSSACATGGLHPLSGPCGRSGGWNPPTMGGGTILYTLAASRHA